jgi:hypothetical protein
VRMEEMTDAYKTLVGILEGKISLEVNKCKDNISNES